MAKNLTDADTFSSPIVVPEGTDFMDDAAGDVEAIAQGLANRTHNLNVHAAKKDVAQTFSALQTFGAGLTAAAGTVTIPHLAGDVDLPGGGLSVSGDLSAGDDVFAGDEFRYGTPPVRTKSVNLAGGSGSGTLINLGEFISIAPAASHHFAIEVPHGAALGIVRAKVALAPAQAADADLVVYKKTIPNYATDSLPTYTAIDSMGTTSLSAGHTNTLDADYGGLTANRAESYIAVVRNLSGSANSFSLSAVDFTFTDPGPRN